MAKSKDGIEVGEFQTSGVNDEMKDTEPKARGGEGSAKSNMCAYPCTELAHKRPMAG